MRFAHDPSHERASPNQLPDAIARDQTLGKRLLRHFGIYHVTYSLINMNLSLKSTTREEIDQGK